jgi:O-antigen ligase
MARVRRFYFSILLVLTLASALATFLRDQDPLLGNPSFWLCASAFVVSIFSTRAGLLATVLALSTTPALHQQINALFGTKLGVWTYPGVDAAIGFIAAWTVKGGLQRVRPALTSLAAGPLLALHLWVTLSAGVAIARNLWQSASEFSWRGLASHAWLLRRIGLQDDYLPIRDVFFCTVAIVLLFSVFTVVSRAGRRLVCGLAITVLVGATANAGFAVWQKATRNGWFLGYPGFEINAFWPDLHAFGTFMAMALAVAVGLLATRRALLPERTFTIAALLAAAIGLYLSGSRSTLLIVSLLLVWVALWTSLKLRGLRRAVPVGLVVVVLVCLEWIFSRGYRGVSLASLNAALGSLDFGSINRALSQRPEIWGAALDMYSNFPLFGLGQGVFYRLSSIEAFSGSPTLISLGGSGAHNFFLQSFVELGPVGLGITIVAAAPYLRMGGLNLRLVSFYALAGVAVGNLYADTLLIRELTMLTAIFAGSYLWEAQMLTGDGLQPLSPSTVRRVTIALLALSLVALVEAALSFDRYPFIYGLRCQEERPLAWDKWTQGTLRVEARQGSTAVNLTLLADRRDLARRPLEVVVAVVDEAAAVLHTQVVRFDRPDEGPRDVALPLGASPGGKLFLELKPSHCYVPLNVGRGHDGRHLGVRVLELKFEPASS